VIDEMLPRQRIRQKRDQTVRKQTMKRPIDTLLMLLFAALAVLSLLPQSALAQTPIVRIDSVEATPKNDFTPDATRFGVPPYNASNSLVPHILNIQDCKAISAVQTGARVRITWSWTNKALLNLSPTYGVKIAPPALSCDANAMAETVVANGCIPIWLDKSFTNPLTASGEIVDVDFKALLGSYASDPTGSNCDANAETDAKIYFILPSTPGIGGTSTGFVGTIMNLHVDLAPPPTPTVSTPEPGNANLRVTWAQADPTDTTISGRVYWSDQPFTSAEARDQASHSDTMTGTTYQITGLNNGTKYYVSVTAVDANGNESSGSPVLSGVPVVTYDLWSKYQEDGGQEQGGYSPCSAQPQGHAGPLALLGAFVLTLLLVVRRRARVAKLLVLAVFVAAPLLVANVAQAASPQTMSADVRFSSYKPGIDNAFPSRTPYADIMKDGDFGIGLNLDWRIWHGFGELGAGFGVGRWSHEGTALLADGTASNDKTRMTMIPLTLDVVYRFDILAERYEFPIVPYIRAGGVYSIWWMLDGVDNISSYTTKAGKSVKAVGATGGLEGTLGLRLLLDVFEPGAARSFDIEMGVNHSYLFAEVQKLWLNDFGSSKSINLSDTVIAFGLAFDL
jgi:MYXO-CTERM domain-containing protein